MKRTKTWVAALLATSMALASASALAAEAGPSLKHPADARASSNSTSPADLDLKRKIRDALVTNRELTTLGKNVAIDAKDGNVTLRGIVTDLSERILVADIATRVAGPSRVTNELDFLLVS